MHTEHVVDTSARSTALIPAAWTCGPGRAHHLDRRVAAQSGDRRLHLRKGSALPRARVRRRSAAVPGDSQRPERDARSFERASWDDALALIAERLSEPREQWGGESILPYSYGGSNGLLTQDTSDATLFRRLGASRLARTVCAAPTGAANQALYGKMPSVTYEDFPRRAADRHLGREPVGVRHPPRAATSAKRRAAARSSIVVDPRTTPLAKHADIHLADPAGHRSAGRARDPSVSVRGRPCRSRVPRRAHPRRRSAARQGAAVDVRARRGRSRRRRRRARSGGAAVCATPARRVIRCGWGQERNRNGGNASAGDPGAARSRPASSASAAAAMR